jgi:hypothetical protein
MVKDHSVTKAAEERGRQMLDEAKRRSEEMLDETERQASLRLDEVRRTAEAQMGEADRYALELLQRLDAQLGAFSGSVRDSINLISSQPAVELTDEAAARRDMRPDDGELAEPEEDEGGAGVEYEDGRESSGRAEPPARDEDEYRDQ